MIVYLLDKNFKKVKLIDEYISLIWTDRYNEAGDFELYLDASLENVKTFQIGMYLSSTSSEHMMIIETVEIKSDIEDGSKLIVSGRSLESILSRRIVWNQTIFENKSIQDIIYKLLNDSVISPTNINRRIANFIFNRIDDEQVNAIKLDRQYTGDNVYSIINDLCMQYGIGFKLLRINGEFQFSIYKGKDHTQNVDSFVMFSPRFDNLISSNVIASIKEMMNVACVAGEGEGNERKIISAGNEIGGLDRIELFVDARNISSRTDSNVNLSDAQYQSLLKAKGIEELNGHSFKTTIESEVDYNGIFQYKKDFDVGDIVNVSNEFGYSGKLRITELVISDSIDGITIVPTFKAI